MTTPPLPASPCVRVALDYTEADGASAGSRFYLSYSGSAPTAANCITLATDIGSAWATNLSPQVQSEYSLTEVDVLDIATLTGHSGVVGMSHAGGDGSPSTPQQVAVNVEFVIGRRYRGGKPRMYLPPPGRDAYAGENKWSTAYTGATNTAMGAFFAAIEALSIGAIGTLQHVNLSYYSGFTNITNSSGRTHAAPKYRAAALVDQVTGYKTNVVMSSQRRRRQATTP